MNIQEDRLEDIWCEECHTTEGGTFLKAGKRLCELCHGKDVSDDSVLAFALRTGDEELIGILEAVAKKGETNPDYWHGIDLDAPAKAKKVGLDIKPTCVGCGMIAGIECQHACSYLFGRADVTVGLPESVRFNEDHQFSLSIAVETDGRNFGAKKPKLHWFNSVRCAELFLIDQGYAKSTRGDGGTIGSGERLLMFLGGTEVVKARKKRSANKSYLAKLAQASENGTQPNQAY